MPYGTVEGVAAKIPQTATGGAYGDAGTPTKAAVEGFLAARSTEIDALLAGLGYATPVTAPDALVLLHDTAELGACVDVLLTQASTAGFRAGEGFDTRAGAYRTLWNERMRRLARPQTLEALGAERAAAPGPVLTGAGGRAFFGRERVY